MTEKNVFALGAFMGVVTAGCFYIYLDSAQPAKRLNRILDNLQADLMISDRESLRTAGVLSFSGEILDLETLKALPAGSEDPMLLAGIRAQAADCDPLYGIFISGFTTCTDLIDGGYLDSFDILSIVGECNDAFGIEISPVDIVPENFNSAAALWSMVQRLKD